MATIAHGSAQAVINEAEAGQLLDELLVQWGPLKRVLLIPPDFTRRHSWAGELTCMLYERLKAAAHVEVLPALGTHAPMSSQQTDTMFPGIPVERIRVHRWREDVVQLGEVPADFVRKISGGQVDYAIPCEVNRLLIEEPWDRIISIGQVVPHEVAGMANHAKNIFVGTGGAETINKSHFLGAVCGMEQAMGRAETPVRAVLNYMGAEFTHMLPISYLLTVRSADADRQIVTRGLFAGDDTACLQAAAQLAQEVNLTMLDEPLQRVVVFLRPDEYHSTWLGNKAIYRTRMAIANGGDLLVLAPGVKEFGEDAEIDRLIRAYGYRGTPATLKAVQERPELAANLSAAAHLIHGSSEGRFSITYAAGGLAAQAIEGVGFKSTPLTPALLRYDPAALRDGWNDLPDGERVFFISNPGLGLWALRSKFS